MSTLLSRVGPSGLLHDLIVMGFLVCTILWIFWAAYSFAGRRGSK